MIGSAPGNGQAKAIGLVPKTGRVSAPGRHGGGGVGEQDGDEALLGQGLHRPARCTAMMRTTDGGGGDPLFAGDLGQERDGCIEGRIGEAVGRIDGEQSRLRPRGGDDGIADDFARPHLFAIGEEPHETVGLQPVGLRAHQGPGDALPPG